MFGNAIYSTGAKPGCRTPRDGGEREHGRGGRGERYGARGEFGGGPFGLHHGGHGGGPGGGPRGRGRRARRGDIRTAALLLLAEEPRNGYQIMQEVQERSGGLWSPSPGSVYPALQQLEDEGLIRTHDSDGRKAFALTDEGQALVAERGADSPAPWEQAAGGPRETYQQVGKLMREVGFAFMQVMRTGSQAQVAKAGDVLAGTRRELYRILADGDTAGETASEPDTGADADTVDTDS
jgi:DNA-binding PadR family transcriptional regulator